MSKKLERQYLQTISALSNSLLAGLQKLSTFGCKNSIVILTKGRDVKKFQMTDCVLTDTTISR